MVNICQSKYGIQWKRTCSGMTFIYYQINLFYQLAMIKFTITCLWYLEIDHRSWACMTILYLQLLQYSAVLILHCTGGRLSTKTSKQQKFDFNSLGVRFYSVPVVVLLKECFLW